MSVRSSAVSLSRTRVWSLQTQTTPAEETAVKAVRIHEYGGPEVLVYEDVPTPEPGPAQLLVKIAAATVNPNDVAVREDRFPTPKQPPKILGSDGAGVVERIGADVTAAKPGDRVAFSGLGIGSEGSYAEYALIAETQVVHIPDGLSFTDAAAIGMTFPAAYYALVTRGALPRGRDRSGAGRVGRRRLRLRAAREGAGRPCARHGERAGRRRPGARPRRGGGDRLPDRGRRRPRPRAHRRQGRATWCTSWS